MSDGWCRCPRYSPRRSGGSYRSTGTRAPSFRRPPTTRTAGTRWMRCMPAITQPPLGRTSWIRACCPRSCRSVITPSPIPHALLLLCRQTCTAACCEQHIMCMPPAIQYHACSHMHALRPMHHVTVGMCVKGSSLTQRAALQWVHALHSHS